MTTITPPGTRSSHSALSPRRLVSPLASGLVWRQDGPQLWVCRFDGDIVGAIEYMTTYITTNARGDVVGTYDTLDAAQAGLATPTAPRARTRSTRLAYRVLAVAVGR